MQVTNSKIVSEYLKVTHKSLTVKSDVQHKHHRNEELYNLPQIFGTPEPPIRGADRIFSFYAPPKRGSEKIIYCSKMGGTELMQRLNERLNIFTL